MEQVCGFILQRWWQLRMDNCRRYTCLQVDLTIWLRFLFSVAHWSHFGTKTVPSNFTFNFALKNSIVLYIFDTISHFIFIRMPPEPRTVIMDGLSESIESQLPVLEMASIELETVKLTNGKCPTFPSAALVLLKSLKGNSRCIDCADHDPQWAAVSYGALLCLQCSGRHRSLGVQVSCYYPLKARRLSVCVAIHWSLMYVCQNSLLWWIPSRFLAFDRYQWMNGYTMKY